MSGLMINIFWNVFCCGVLALGWPPLLSPNLYVFFLVLFCGVNFFLWRDAVFFLYSCTVPALRALFSVGTKYSFCIFKVEFNKFLFLFLTTFQSFPFRDEEVVQGIAYDLTAISLHHLGQLFVFFHHSKVQLAPKLLKPKLSLQTNKWITSLH